ncbi:hypothetical protein D3C81_1476100 [compost metagenome]
MPSTTAGMRLAGVTGTQSTRSDGSLSAPRTASATFRHRSTAYPTGLPSATKENGTELSRWAMRMAPACRIRRSTGAPSDGAVAAGPVVTAADGAGIAAASSATASAARAGHDNTGARFPQEGRRPGPGSNM